jgi:HCOMODA/2-hydroxy-3-carboxy-muconic semialdehyde decarboxylase
MTMTDVKEDLVAANRILAAHGVVDGYGHVSVRHPHDRAGYLMSWAIAPERVTEDDIVEHDLESRSTQARDRPLYSERFIHGEIYKVRPDVQSIVHHHSPSVIPFGVTPAPLRAIYHMASFLGTGIPVYEIREAGGMTDMLVRTPELGIALAQAVGPHPAALMRGHGAVVVGNTIQQSVARSVYMELNARLQHQAMALGPVTYLDPEEARLGVATQAGYSRSWALWKEKALGRRPS